MALAERGHDVAITYRNKAARAEGVVAEVERRGGRALAVGGDMTLGGDLDVTLFGALNRWAGWLDVVVLNASGGMERDLIAANPDYPLRINRDAQLALVTRARPLLRRGGTIVFVTSHWAHLHGRVDQLPSYEPVAASKHAGEQALRGLTGELGAEGIRLLVVTGDLIEGTITAKLLERLAPGLAASRRDAGGRVPTTAEMAEAIAAAVADPVLPSGHTVVVGGALDALLRVPR